MAVITISISSIRTDEANPERMIVSGYTGGLDFRLLTNNMATGVKLIQKCRLQSQSIQAQNRLRQVAQQQSRPLRPSNVVSEGEVWTNEEEEERPNRGISVIVDDVTGKITGLE